MKHNHMQVEAICNGYVIDHIPSGQGVKILKLFSLTDTKQRVTVGFNLPTHDGGAKDLIKVENTEITKSQANQLALLAPNATINIIENFKVTDKHSLTLPSEVENVFPCPNSNCITHGEPVISSFSIKKSKGNIGLKCKYCEKTFSKDIVTEQV
ncbi:aspartate carbamoyltransferase regulatory subunit [Moritella sp. F3]|uniref:aspartate carbamoyltransferase regulatory subunit n=1 Tax=Moritella sp. F3 TaxID=2718882 RepID=UPI0018E146AE|nr:aspartate carbamoyltransferase regulatory subunit [Moritella sp. F3]GIC79396.1 aspartate carbamoyltransferase regulatory chain [Moritella sp. F1]GIC84115.1 aspartate carbamoyltransferase regulatory chain [Moritella sp. F3]